MAEKSTRKVPPGPDRRELRFSRHQFDRAADTDAQTVRYGLDPDVLPARKGNETVPVRVVKAAAKGELWALHASPEILKKLPPRQCRAMMLFAWLGLSHKEVGDEMDVCEGQSRRIVYFAKKNLVSLSRQGRLLKDLEWEKEVREQIKSPGEENPLLQKIGKVDD
jgi:DNA-directed RNA polymerase specialized sigma24 family protein